MSAGHFIVLDCQKATLKKVTAVTTNTYPQKFFSFFQTCGLVDANQLLVNTVFTPRPRQHSFAVSRALGGTCWRSSHFCNIFAAGSDSTSCQDYEKYEFVEYLSEETQINDLFTHCKLQPLKLSQYTLTTHLNSW